jgi:hypothetical protein
MKIYEFVNKGAGEYGLGAEPFLPENLLLIRDDTRQGSGDETDPTVANFIKQITTGDINTWNQAYSWGNHALAGYALANHTHYSFRTTDVRDLPENPNRLNDFLYPQSSLPLRSVSSIFATIPGAGSSWRSTLSVQGNSQLYSTWELIGPCRTTADDDIYFRSGVGGTWRDPRKIIHDGNIGNYTYTKTDGDGRYVRKTGDVMTGALTTPSLTTNVLASSGYIDVTAPFIKNLYISSATPNILRFADKKYTVTRTGPMTGAVSALFNGKMNSAWGLANAPDIISEANPVVFEITNIDGNNSHTSLKPYFLGWRDHYAGCYITSWKLEVYGKDDSETTPYWVTVLDRDNITEPWPMYGFNLRSNDGVNAGDTRNIRVSGVRVTIRKVIAGTSSHFYLTEFGILYTAGGSSIEMVGGVSVGGDTMYGDLNFVGSSRPKVLGQEVFHPGNHSHRTDLQNDDRYSQLGHEHNKIIGSYITDLTSIIDKTQARLTLNRFQASAIGAPSGLPNNANGVLNLQSVSDEPRSYGKQIAFGDNDDLYMRRFTPTAFGPWRKIWHEGNLNPADLSGVTLTNYVLKAGDTMTGNLRVGADTAHTLIRNGEISLNTGEDGTASSTMLDLKNTRGGGIDVLNRGSMRIIAWGDSTSNNYILRGFGVNMIQQFQIDMSGNADFEGSIVSMKAQAYDMSEEAFTVNTTTTINLWDNPVKSYNLLSNQTIRLQSGLDATKCFSATLIFKQDSVGGRVINWDTGIGIQPKWQMGIPVLISDMPNSVTFVCFYWDGTTLYGWKMCGF